MHVPSPHSLRYAHSLSSRQQQGLLTAPTDQAFVFLSADNLGKLSSWQDHIGANLGEALAQSHPALLPGLRKQYEIHQKLIADKEQAQAEYVFPNFEKQ